MSHSEPQLTAELQKRIVSFLRAGGSPSVAAEAAGLPRRVYEKWLRRGNRRRAMAPYREFAHEVMEAAAQAILKAEIAVFDKRPLDWLKCGPGKETSRRPGWSAPPKALTMLRALEENPLAHPLMQRLFAEMLDALTPHPEARELLADKVSQSRLSRRSRRPEPKT